MGSRFARVLAGVWAGVLVCIGAMAAPTAFATLPSADAGRVAARLFAQEAYLSLAVALVLYVIERQRSRDAAAAGVGSVLSGNIVILFGTLLCTVAGYFALQPMMAAARTGQAGWSFATLHAIAGALFVLKGVLVLALVWRLSAIRVAVPPS
jgi:F0F1-type ATP synthase assembly protein I